MNNNKKVYDLEMIENKREYHPGYGAGSGFIIEQVWKCPCGKGTVQYQKDDIPGFRDSEFYIFCSKCKEKYDIERGYYSLKNTNNNKD